MRLTDLKTPLWILALSMTLLAGCANGPGTPSSQPTVDENGNRVRTPNPYLADPVTVPSAAQSALVRARDFYQQEKFAAAETELQQVVRQWPTLSGAWLNLAKVQLKLADTKSAEQSLTEAVTANPKNVFAWNSLGVLLRDQGRFAEAEKAYITAIEHWQDFPAAHRNLGILYDLYLHMPKQALEHYRAAQELQVEEDRVLAGWILDLQRRM